MEGGGVATLTPSKIRTFSIWRNVLQGRANVSLARVEGKPNRGRGKDPRFRKSGYAFSGSSSSKRLWTLPHVYRRGGRVGLKKGRGGQLLAL